MFTVSVLENPLVLPTLLQSHNNHSTHINLSLLQNLWCNGEQRVKALTYYLLTDIIKQAPEPYPDELIRGLLVNIKYNLSTEQKPKDTDTVLLSLYTLNSILSLLQYRYLFIAEGGLNYLVKVINEKIKNPQIVYSALYCVYQCSFSSQYYEGRFDRDD